jgi:zinc-binding alcohol dehydrogenase/oxidoreductase
MKALVIQDMALPLEDRLRITEVPTPEPAPHHVRIRILAAALNHRDEWIRQGQYAKIRPGVILGSDGCGTVESLGSGVDAGLLGKEVIINPSIGWGSDERAQASDYAILGLPVDGTFAEYLCVPATQIVEKPAHLTAAQAAALPLAGLTAYRAVVSQSAVAAHQKVLITGIGGGVAQFAAQFAAALGAEVWVSSGSHEKLGRAVAELGVAGGAVYKEHEWLKALSARVGFPASASGFDAVIDSAGGADVNALLLALKPGGVFTFFGATAGRPTELNWQAIFWRQLRIQGTTMGSDAEFRAMVALVAEKKIVPIVDSIRSFSDIGSAFDSMRVGSQFGKLVVTF